MFKLIGNAGLSPVKIFSRYLLDVIACLIALVELNEDAFLSSFGISVFVGFMGILQIQFCILSSICSTVGVIFGNVKSRGVILASIIPTS